MPTILTKKSDTPGSIPATANLTNAAGGAELAVNTADKRLFTINSTSQVVELGTNPSSITCADGSFTVARIGSGTVTQLTSTSATITTLTATSATVTNLTATSLVISNLSVASMNITTLTSASATITNLVNTSASITTLTNNPTFGAGTANGVLYLNGSKVATSGSALTFDGTTLLQDVSASNSQANFRIKTSTTGAVSNAYFNINGTDYFRIYTSVDDTGLRNLQNTPLYFSINNVEQMRLTSTGLGIGTSSPTSKLTVAGGAVNLTSNSSNHNIYQGTGWIWTSDGTSSGTTRAGIYGNSNGTLSLFGGSTISSQVTLDSSGNLGIGTSSPAYKLDVAGAINSSADVISQGNDARISLYRSAGINYFDWASGQSLYFSTQTSAGGAGRSTKMVLTDGGNLGIGTSSPANRLHVVSSSQTVARFDATNTEANIRFDNNGATANLFGTAGAAFYWYSGSAERMRLDASGNLGLGVTPSAWSIKALQVNNSSIASDSNDTYLQSNAFFDGAWKYINTAEAAQYYQVNGSHVWRTASSGTAGNAITFTQAMTLDASGNLGVGTTSIAAVTGFSSSRVVEQIGGTVGYGQLRLGNNAGTMLDHDNSSTTTTTLRNLYGATSASALMQIQSGYITFGTGTSYTERARITSGGNFGLGTTSPSIGAGFGIHVAKTDGAGVKVDALSTNAVVELQAGTSTAAVWGSTNHPLLFGTNATERARITAAGQLLVGLTSSAVGEYLSVQASNNSWMARIANTNASPRGEQIIFTGASPNGTANWFLYCEDSTAQRASIRSNGGLANYQSNNVDLSDARTKKDITPAASMWDKIGALEIVTYKYNDQTHDDVNVGVIAQQVESVEPVWVDNDSWGEAPEGEEPLKTVYTKDITFAAIKALQEAMARIEKLEAEVAALKGA